MENIQRTQQSQKNIVNTQQKQYPRLSTRDEQEIDEQNQQKMVVVHVVNHKTIQQTQSDIINKRCLDQNTHYCRICLEGEITQSKLLSPCNCSNCVHDSCLLEWMGRKQLTNYMCLGAYFQAFQFDEMTQKVDQVKLQKKQQRK